MSMIKVYDDPDVTPTTIRVNVENRDEGHKNELLFSYGQGVHFFVRFGDSEDIYELNHESFKIDYTGFLPQLYVEFYDELRIFTNGAPEKDVWITYYMDSKTKHTVRPWHQDFYMMTYECDDYKSSPFIRMWCKFAVPNMFKYKMSSINDTSWNALRKTTKEIGIGFASNVGNTNDKMKWIRPGQHSYGFILHVASAGWRGETSYMYPYFDPYYYFCYVDVAKAFESQFGEEKMYRTYFGNRPELETGGEGIESPLVITNSSLFTGSNYHCDLLQDTAQYSHLNQEYGSNRYLFFYDSRGEWDNSERREKSNGPNDGAWNGSMKSTLLDSVNYKSRDDIKSKMLEQYRGSAKATYAGRLDADNAHSHLLWAREQNSYNLSICGSRVAEVELSVINPWFKRMSKVLFIVYSGEEKSLDNYDVVLSGFYLVQGFIIYETDGEMKQRIRLIRKADYREDQDEVAKEIGKFIQKN